MMENNNTMVMELNDNELDMVNGSGIFTNIINSVKDIAPSITGGIKEAASNVWEAAKLIADTGDVRR